MPNATRCSWTWSLRRSRRRPNSWSFKVPRSRSSRAVQRRGPVGRRMRLASRSATTSLMVRPRRRARTESGSLPSCPTSATDQGAPQRVLFLNVAGKAIFVRRFSRATGSVSFDGGP
jgi:hypothetical protein